MPSLSATWKYLRKITGIGDGVFYDVDVAAKGLLPFGFGVGDNCGLFVDIPLPSLIGK